MSYGGVFGELHTGEDVEAAVTAFLKRWMMTYVAHAEERAGDVLGSHPAPRTWSVENRFDSFPEERLPIVLVIATGTSGTPLMDGEGYYRAKYGIGIATVASGKNRESARHNAMVYAAGVRTALLQKSSLETDWIKGIDWQGDAYDNIPPEDSRQLAAVRSAYLVDARAVVNGRMGLGQAAPNPPPDPTVPPEDWPTVQEFNITVDQGDVVN